MEKTAEQETIKRLAGSSLTPHSKCMKNEKFTRWVFSPSSELYHSGAVVARFSM
jgi:hypothetical protein